MIVETWLLIRSRIDFATAERFLGGVNDANCEILNISKSDWRRSTEIARDFPDQTFSIVDRISFAVMERLEVERAISFDDDFVIYRYGVGRAKAFEVLR